MYRLAGYPKPIANPNDHAMTKPTYAQQMLQFKKLCRCTVKHTWEHKCRTAFEPAMASMHNLQGLAVIGAHAGPSFNVSLSTEGKDAVATQIVKLTRKCSGSALSGFLKNQKQFKATQLVTRGKASWDDSIPKLGHIIFDMPHNPNLQASDTMQGFIATDASSSDHNTMHVMVCPSCNRPSAALGHKFNVANLSQRVQCYHCGKRPTTVLWKCNCGMIWHKCPRHRHHTAEKAKVAKRTSRIGKGTQNSLCNASPEDLLDDDLLQASKRARTHHYGTLCHSASSGGQHEKIPFRMLPSTLRDRFPGAATPEPPRPRT